MSTPLISEITEERRLIEKHTLRRPGGKYMSASEKAKIAEKDETISASKLKSWKLESDEDDSDFECYNKSDVKPVHVEIDKEVTKGEQIGRRRIKL